jgi:hypothetical protein
MLYFGGNPTVQEGPILHKYQNKKICTKPNFFTVVSNNILPKLASSVIVILSKTRIQNENSSGG